jgi:hypothetical protein
MSTRIITREDGIDESNLARIINEESCRTLGRHHYALVAGVNNINDLDDFLKKQGTSIREIIDDYYHRASMEKDDFSNAIYAFVSPTRLGLHRDLNSPFLSQRDLRAKGIEPIALYKVIKDSESREGIKEIRSYHKLRTKV